MPRPPKPTALKVLEGNRGKRALPANEPKPRPITPEIPPYLGEIGRERWQQLLPELEIMGTLTVVDRDVLGRHCLAYQRYVQAAKALESEEVVISRGTGGRMLNPWLAEMNAADAILDKTGAQLGIGAAHRTKIEVKKADDGPSAVQRIIAANTRR